MGRRARVRYGLGSFKSEPVEESVGSKTRAPGRHTFYMGNYVKIIREVPDINNNASERVRVRVDNTFSRDRREFILEKKWLEPKFNPESPPDQVKARVIKGSGSLKENDEVIVIENRYCHDVTVGHKAKVVSDNVYKAIQKSIPREHTKDKEQYTSQFKKWSVVTVQKREGNMFTIKPYWGRSRTCLLSNPKEDLEALEVCVQDLNGSNH